MALIIISQINWVLWAVELVLSLSIRTESTGLDKDNLKTYGYSASSRIVYTSILVGYSLLYYPLKRAIRAYQ